MTFLKVRKEKICDKKEKNKKRREKLKRKTLMHFSPRISEEIYINYILPLLHTDLFQAKFFNPQKYTIVGRLRFEAFS